MKLLLSLLVLPLVFGQATPIQKANANSELAYSSFEAMPEEFELFSRSDTSKTNITFSNGDMVIAHNNANVRSKQYYGALLRLDPSKYYRDFSLSVEFKVGSALNEKSWIGLMSRAQKETNYLSGYLSRFQYGGGSYFAAIDDTATFYNDSLVSSGKLNDGNYHTIKIEANKYDISSYLDNELVVTSDMKTKDNVMNYTKPKGELDLIVSNMSASIKSITINGVSEAVSDTNPIVLTYQDDNKMVNAPTVVLDLKSKEELSFDETKLPSNIILHLDDELNVLDEKSEAIARFEEVLNQNLNHKIIPIAYLSSLASANALISYLNDNTDLIDIAIMSKDLSLLKTVKEKVSYVRAIYDADPFKKSDVLDANKNYANVIAIKDSDATKENVNYIHARFKTVWVKLNTNNELAIHNAINSGAYGLISERYVDVYNAYQKYDSNSFVRSYFNVAHRGLSKGYNENSLNGCMAAIDSGATHIEIDGYLTTDNEIVIMHDGTVDRTSNGTGQIESMSLAEVKKLKLDLVEPNVEIPTLKEIIAGMKERNTDAVLIFELKTAKTEIVNYLKEVLDEYDYYDHVVAISFYLESLKAMKNTLPEIPTAYLGTVNTKKFLNALKTMGDYNTVVDTTRNSGDTTFNEQYLKDHGLVGYYWTYGTKDEVKKAADNGLVGLTFDDAATLSSDIKYVYASSFVTKNELKVGDNVPVNVYLFNRTSLESEGEIFALQDDGSSYKAIIKYSVGDRSYYTQEVEITKDFEKAPDTKDDEEKEESNTNLALIITLSVIGGVALIAIVIFLILKFLVFKK